MRKVMPEDAMTFPDDPKRFLRTIIIKEKIYPNVKKELMERLSKYLTTGLTQEPSN